jgi:cytolysin-activating lysine-acyltransferase
MWVTDWITPFGHAHDLYTTGRELLPQVCFRYLYHRGNERGLRVMSYRGRAITPDQARQWWRERPMLAPPSDSPVATVYFNPASATPPKE